MGYTSHMFNQHMDLNMFKALKENASAIVSVTVTLIFTGLMVAWFLSMFSVVYGG